MRRVRKIGMLVAAVFAVAAFSVPAASASTGSIDLGGPACTVNPPTIINPGTTGLTSANTTVGPCAAFGVGGSIGAGTLNVVLNGPGVNGTIGPAGTSVNFNATLFGFTVCTVTLTGTNTLFPVAGSSPPQWTGSATIPTDGSDNGGAGCPAQPYSVNVMVEP